MGLATSTWVESTVFAAILGLIVGSFLNVVVYRVPRQMSVLHPPSHCPACDARLAGVDLVPVFSWLALRGRCRRCRTPISVRYPLVELATAALFAGLAVALRWLDPLPSLGITAGATLAALVIEVDGDPTPGPVALAAAAGPLTLAVVAGALGQPARIGWGVLGAGLAGGCALLASTRTAGRRWPAVVVIAALGWSAGWLWAPGGALVAGWVALAAATGTGGSVRRLPLPLACSGGLAVVVLAAVLSRV